MGYQDIVVAHPNRENVLNQRNILKDVDTSGKFKDWGLALTKLGIGKNWSIKYNLEGSNKYMGIATMKNTGWIIGVEAH